MLRKLRNLDNWTKMVVFYLWGSPFLGKASAYVALALGALLTLDPRVLWDRFYRALSRPGDPLGGMAWALLVSLVYGFGEVIYGVMLGYPLFTALQILVFNICPVYVLLGIWVGARHPSIVRRYIRFSAWLVVIYTPLYILFLNKLGSLLSGMLPGGDLGLLGSPGTGSVPLLGLIAYEPNLARFWLPILVLTCWTIANEARADWVGLALALIIWGILAKKMGRVLGIAGFIFALLLIAFLADFRLPPIPGRGGDISARETVARMAASISPDMAEAVGSNGTNARFYYGTVYWRTRWWAAIRQEVSKDSTTMLFGLGYGYPLGKLNSFAVAKEGVRSPHSIFYFAFAYSGCIGVAIFFWLQTCIFHLLWRDFKVTGQIYGLAFYAYQFVGSFFGNSLETPQSGIFIYLLVGLLIGPMFLTIESDAVEDNEPLNSVHSSWVLNE